MRNDSFKLRLLKEALPHIALWQMPNVGSGNNLTPFNSEREGLSKQLSFAVDRRWRFRTNAGLLVAGQTVINEVINYFSRYLHGSHVAERLAYRLQMRLKLWQASAARQLVMLFQFVEQLVNVDLLSLGNERGEALTLGPNFFHSLVEFL